MKLANISKLRFLAAAGIIATVEAAALGRPIQPQSGTTNAQQASPGIGQTGTGADGTSKDCPEPLFCLAFNSDEPQAPAAAKLGDVSLLTGLFSPGGQVDVHIPAAIPWIISRSFNGQQVGGNATESYQGINWFQNSQPEIIHDVANDVVHLVYAADRYVSYEQENSTSNFYVGINGAAGFFEFDQGDPEADPPTVDTWKFVDGVGLEATFIGFGEGSGSAAGQLWKIASPGLDAEAYVGSGESPEDAIAEGGWDAEGCALDARDSDGNLFEFVRTLSEIGGTTRLGSVTVTQGAFQLARVDYGYYTSSGDASGSPGDLKYVKKVNRLSDGVSSERFQYYRYWKGTYNATTNPGTNSQLQLILDEEGARRFDWDDDADFNQSYLGAETEDLLPYAATYLEYDAAGKVRKVAYNGQCGCPSGGAEGEFLISYEDNSSHPATSGYDPEWKTRATIQCPDGTFRVQYVDETGQALSSVIADGDPTGSPNYWPTWIVRDPQGYISEVWSPKAVGSYNHATGAFTRGTATDGEVKVFVRESAGPAAGFVVEERYARASDYDEADEDENGPWDVSYLQHAFAWDVSTTTMPLAASDYVRPLPASVTTYTDPWVTSGASGSVTTAYSYTKSSLQPLAIWLVNEALPTISTAKNGSGEEHHVYYEYRADGQLLARSERSVEDENAQIVERWVYNNSGLLIEHYLDADTSATSLHTSVESVAAGALNQVESFTYDNQGRTRTHSTFDGRKEFNHYSELADRRMVRMRFPDSDGLGTFTGPAEVRVVNLTGRIEFSATVRINLAGTSEVEANFVNELSDEPFEAVGTGLGALTDVEVWRFDATGKYVQEKRTYFLTPTSGEGIEGTNYDSSRFARDGMGRTVRSIDPTGTIERTSYGPLGLVATHLVGTNDYGLLGGSSSGPYDLVQTDETEYDQNGRVIETTQYTGTGSRVTAYLRNLRGEIVVETVEDSPKRLYMRDNLGRVTAVGEYLSTATLTVDSDAVLDETDRLALTTSQFDERGNQWKSTIFEINATTGEAGDSISALTWFDELGRPIKRDGEQLVKYEYDRLSRVVREYLLASCDEDASVSPTYDDMFGVDGDVVLEENASQYDTLGRLWAASKIERLYNDVGSSKTTGALDTNADGIDGTITGSDVKGRLQVTAFWFDDLSRVVGSAEYGTNHATDNAATFTRSTLASTPPASTDTLLVTTNHYDDANRVDRVVDPRGIETRWEFDDAARETATIENYVDGTPGGGAADDEDRITRTTYANGLVSSKIADMPGSEPDQVTEYSYGTAVGVSAGDSQVATGHLLSTIAYPDSEDSDDVERFAYNRQGDPIWKRDQAGNEFRRTYDEAGRLTALAVDTLASGFDGAVRRIQLEHDVLGRLKRITQHSNPSTTSIIDQIEYAYDGWGMPAAFRQDIDSAVGSGTYWEVAYEYAAANAGRNTLRRTQVTLPGGTVYKYHYRSGTPSHDSNASRVTAIRDASDNDIVTYQYNGAESVVRTGLEEIGTFSKLYNGSGTTFGRLDRFNRVVISSWTRDTSPARDVYKATLSYDRASNIERKDEIHNGHDATYDHDGLGRIREVSEGRWDGSAIVDDTRRQAWGLGHTGNWLLQELDLNGDGLLTGTGELDETREHNEANEVETRDLDSDSSVDRTFVYDAVGSLLDDGEYTYEWDAFRRLRKVRTKSSGALVSEYWYNGAGYLITRHQDVDADGDVDSYDKKYHTAYDERWRAVATYREGDSDPKELFLYHAAGAKGLGTASYVDSVVLRDRDNTSGWNSASDGVLEERLYYLQNWRADVVALLKPNGSGGASLAEWTRYSAYGVPFSMPFGDADSDGDCDSADVTQVQAWRTGGSYDVRGDVDLNGVINAADVAAVTSNTTTVQGYGVLSGVGVGNRKGFAGYEGDAKLVGRWHVRHRVLDSRLGRWLQRDPLGYVDGMSLSEYALSCVLRHRDPSGLDVIDFVEELTGTRPLNEDCAWAELEILWWGTVLDTCQGFRVIMGSMLFLDDPKGWGLPDDIRNDPMIQRSTVTTKACAIVGQSIGMEAAGAGVVKIVARPVSRACGWIEGKLAISGVPAAIGVTSGTVAGQAFTSSAGRSGDAFVELARTAAAKATSFVSATVTAATRTNYHHIFPQQFREKFAKLGLKEIDEYTIVLPEQFHQALHAGRSSGAPGRYNKLWDDFFRQNPDATLDNVVDFAEKMLKDFGIDRLPIVEWGK